MHLRNETRIKNGVKIKSDCSRPGNIVIIATSLKTNRHLVCEYECPYNYAMGYDETDVLELIRIENEFMEKLTNG